MIIRAWRNETRADRGQRAARAGRRARGRRHGTSRPGPAVGSRRYGTPPARPPRPGRPGPAGLGSAGWPQLPGTDAPLEMSKLSMVEIVTDYCIQPMGRHEITRNEVNNICCKLRRLFEKMLPIPILAFAECSSGSRPKILLSKMEN
jgi:hypothetical protein